MAARPPRGVLGDAQSLASLQARLRQRTDAASSSSVPVYELHTAAAANDTSVAAAGAGDAANTTPAAGGGGGGTTLQYSGIAARAQSPSVVGSASQCRSLRDRIYERTLTRSPLPPTAVGPVGASTNKDLYAHEQNFPIQTVFEVQRISNPVPEHERPQSATQPSLRQSDTLLTDVESAALIKTLERKLVESATAADAQKAESDALKARVAELEAQMAEHDKTAADSTTRLVEAQAQCEAARQSIVTAVDTEREKIRAEFSKAEEALKAEHASALASLQDELDRVKMSVGAKENDQSNLFTLVADLQKAVRDGAARQRDNAEVIARLDRELQESRTRAATVSTGFHAKDKQVRDALSQVDALQKECAALGLTRAELEKTSSQLAALRKEYDEATAELAQLRVVADEKQRLQQHCANLEQDVSMKNDELGRLRGQVDVVRQQADAAYARSSTFRGAVDQSRQSATNAGPHEISQMGANMSQGPSYAALPVGGSTPLPPSNAPPTADQGPHSAALKQLRSDIMAEDARTDAERNRWKSGTN